MKDVKYVSYETGVDRDGFVVSKWIAFVKEDGHIKKETKQFDWSIASEETAMTPEEYSKLVSVR